MSVLKSLGVYNSIILKTGHLTKNQLNYTIINKNNNQTLKIWNSLQERSALYLQFLKKQLVGLRAENVRNARTSKMKQDLKMPYLLKLQGLQKNQRVICQTQVVI
ncbi:Hypothetical_protein [Hexamita inflata]|uniref:Hypothetical_protein n=1 Tax=Hexamita inflata TaxID=28002 RepID=A0AA86Q3E4_9EUKA|nr:Hypothetical protein HINF_LOCUS32499 [Hexamita inflata]